MLVIEVSIEREADAWASYFIGERLSFRYEVGPMHLFTVTNWTKECVWGDALEEVAAILDMSGAAGLSVDVKAVA